MFPIICLAWQKDVINQYIEKHSLFKSEIFTWFEIYGELVMPDEASFLRWSSPLLTGREYYRTTYTKPLRYFIFRSNFGFLNVFEFINSDYHIALIRTSMRG